MLQTSITAFHGGGVVGYEIACAVATVFPLAATRKPRKLQVFGPIRRIVYLDP
ncbi:MAG: hypothetical protein AB9866_22445 [Syntrophobacteraceae bacterium]